MKQFLLDLINYILDLLLVKDKKEIENEEPTIEPILEPVEEPKEQEVTTTPETIKEVIEEPKTTKEVYSMLSLKERQTYLKKLGLYTAGIDGVIGEGSKKAIKQFNIIFLNNDSDTYYEKTDKLLRIIYKSYCASKYMVATDWQYFKNFKKSEYKCHCNGKYCNGYPHEISMRLVMLDQYIRNYYDASVTLTSGVRCKKHNKNVGGVTNSKHLVGRASDSIVKGKTAAEVKKMIYSNKNTKIPFVNYSYVITSSAIHKDVIL